MSVTPRSRSADKRYYGIAEGIVTDNKDPEKEGRVLVRFPWFDDHMVSEWCRVAQHYAGPGYGAFFVPEIGDEVIIGFTHGDMRLPIVLGGVYNGKDKPSTFRDASKDEKLIRTKGGHQVLLNDTTDKRQVELTTNGRHSVDLNDQDKAVRVKSSGGHEAVLDDAGSSVSVKTSGGHQVLLDDAGGSVTVKTSGGQSIVFDRAGTVTITGATISLEGKQIQLGGAAAVEQVLLGTAFLTMFNTHIHPLIIPTLLSGPPTPPIVPETVVSKTVTTAL